MARELIDLLWRDHPDAPSGGSRGPRAKVTTSQAVDTAIALADAEGLAAVTVRRLAMDLRISAMALYTHVGSRADLLVLMADTARVHAPRPRYASQDWRQRVRQVAESELALYVKHWWLLDVTDQRSALGPGAIARYDHQLHAFDHTNLTDLDRDATLTFVLDFARSSAQARRPDPDAPGVDIVETWTAWHQRLAGYLGDDFPLARRVGNAAGQEMQAAYSPEHAWRFGLDRVLDALEPMLRTAPPDLDPPRPQR